MLIFAVDAEPGMLTQLHTAIAQAEPHAQILDFSCAPEVLAAIAEGTKPDVVFSDIQLPGMDGLDLAVQVRTEAPYAKVIFVTDDARHTMEAYRRHVVGYVMKPANAEKIREELDALLLLRAAPASEKLEVRCFGSFEVFWQGKPLRFPRNKSKEVLAYLVDHEGAFCTAGEVINALWENDDEGKDSRRYLRVLTSDLNIVLSEIGMKDALVKKRGQMAVNCDKLDCDYYRLLQGDPEAISAFQGEYMKQYSWAEETAGRLHFRWKEQKN